MKIGEVAQQAGVSVRSLRYYEEKDLLPAMRTASGQREYLADAVGQVRLIQQLYTAGLSSTLVREVLPKCLFGEELPEGFVDRLISERDRIDQQIADLVSVRARLEGLIISADDPEACPTFLKEESHAATTGSR